MEQSKKGLLLGLSAYFFWGIAPVFFKLLENVPTYEIIAHRIIWSLLLLILIITLSKGWKNVAQILSSPKTLLWLLFTSILVVSNWTIYVWAVNHGQVLEASLGYFMCPLASILLAIIFLKERFRPLQWLALGFATVGILIQLWIFGSVPKIALGLALTFSIYGFMRKKIAVEAITGLFYETILLFPIALLYLYVFTTDSMTNNIFANPLKLNMLLLACGVVTTIPLILFNAAAVRIKLSTLGLIQYIGPTLSFLLAIFAYNEPLSKDTLITFIFIWSGIFLFIWDSIKQSRKVAPIAE